MFIFHHISTGVTILYPLGEKKRAFLSDFSDGVPSGANVRQTLEVSDKTITIHFEYEPSEALKISALKGRVL